MNNPIITLIKRIITAQYLNSILLRHDTYRLYDPTLYFDGILIFNDILETVTFNTCFIVNELRYTTDSELQIASNSITTVSHITQIPNYLDILNSLGITNYNLDTDETRLRELCINYTLTNLIDTNITDELLIECKNDAIQQYFETSTLLPEQMIDTYLPQLDINRLLTKRKFSVDFLYKYKDIIDWNVASSEQIIPEALIEEKIDEINWNSISLYQDLSAKFVEKYRNKLNLHFINLYKAKKRRKQREVAANGTAT